MSRAWLARQRQLQKNHATRFVTRANLPLMRGILFIGLLISPLNLVAKPSAELDLAPVRQWVDHQSKVRSVRADFIQERQLRSLKKPLRHPGRLYFQSPGSFRWELGKPVQTLVLQEPDADLLVLRPTRKEGLRYDREQMAEQGGARAVAMLDAGFPRTWEGFQANFSISQVEQADGLYRFTGSLNDRRASVAVRKVQFTVAKEGWQLRSFYLRFRDGSSITTTFTDVKENAAVDAKKFHVDLTGYKMKKG